MCGICGIAGGGGESVIRAMTDAMVHRGPDDEGVHLGDGIGLGVRRLSIIDVAGGHQPISVGDGGITVAQNGEIYNYVELQRDIVATGVRLRSRCDTEVIGHLYAREREAFGQKIGEFQMNQDLIAQMVAHEEAARLLGVRAVICMPEDAPRVKVEGVQRDGAEIVFTPTGSDARHQVARDLQERHGYVMVEPYDDPAIIAGQGTAGMEIAEDLPALGSVLVPVSGGGLSAGIATAVKALAPAARVYGVEPELAADARESLERGEIVRWPAELTGRTMADGLRNQALGPLPFEHLRRYLDSVRPDLVLIAKRKDQMQVAVSRIEEPLWRENRRPLELRDPRRLDLPPRRLLFDQIRRRTTEEPVLVIEIELAAQLVRGVELRGDLAERIRLVIHISGRRAVGTNRRGRAADRADRPPHRGTRGVPFHCARIVA